MSCDSVVDLNLNNSWNFCLTKCCICNVADRQRALCGKPCLYKPRWGEDQTSLARKKLGEIEMYLYLLLLISPNFGMPSSPLFDIGELWRELWREIWWWPTVLWTSQLTADSNTNHYHHWSIFLSIKIQFSSQWFPKNQLNKRLSAHCTLWVKLNKVGKLLVANICVFDSTICNILSTLIK